MSQNLIVGLVFDFHTRFEVARDDGEGQARPLCFRCDKPATFTKEVEQRPGVDLLACQDAASFLAVALFCWP